MAEDPILKLETDIKRFLEVYKVLPPEGKAAFEAQMSAAVSKVDDKTKRLYQALLQSAKDGLSVDKAIQEMQRAPK